ncbi:non-hemolytic phospholipase C [Longispora fulva]|uniref:phospholipase C n=1 Tax=Longispora fulva TaxID=619741 RepID=A0A8J7GD52_9ACTN|nr:phospholipase C, phosphocholine-specific [Longispora fulva]MBG6135895.1 phospholipase C [Longispora fulva]GIG55862.1 non-hemolytic phospholipase C [Longispora fulva]
MGIARRRFLIGSAGVAGSVALPAASAAAPGAAPGPEVAVAGTGTIADVKHVVILMQENRSFDHYFGTMRGVRGFGDRTAISINGGYSVFNQPNWSGRQYPFPLRGPSGSPDPETLAQCQGDLAHGWSDQHSAWNSGKLDNWLPAKAYKIGCMGFMDRKDLPFHYALADAYTLCDAYHSSGLTATGPNRTFHWSGMIDAAGRFGSPAKDGGEESGLTWRTYAEELQDAGISWRVYQNASDNYGDNALAYFTQFANAAPGTPLHDRGMVSVPRVSGSTPDDILAAIRADVRAGTLPQVSWVVTDQATSEHPIGPPVNGERFVSGLLNALNADPAVFNSTVVLVNYDENDGFFDHVPPPAPPAGTPDEFVGGTPVGLGFRVPMFVVSPWSRGGWVTSETFDHTSVLRFLETWSTAIGKPATCRYISAWRRAVCGDLTSAFDFAHPVYGLPALPTPGAAISTSYCGPLPNPSPSTNALPAQEPGTRQARALPYQPTAHISSWDYGADGSIRLNITMANDGPLAGHAAHFAVYANAFRSGGPWQYTVSPGQPVTDFFNCGPGLGSGRYDFTVVGPNRFLRRLTGTATSASRNVEVRSRVAVEAGTGKLAIFLDMVNGSAVPVTFTVAAANYRTDGPWTYTVPAGQTVSDYWNAVAYTNGWYDLAVSLSADGTWSRRFTGHIETGAPSVTG